MKAKLTSAFALAAVFAAVFAFSLSSRASDRPAGGEKMNSIYDFSLKDIDHKEVNLSRYRGKVVLVVNVASRCGYTPQYEYFDQQDENQPPNGLRTPGISGDDDPMAISHLINDA